MVFEMQAVEGHAGTSSHVPQDLLSKGGHRKVDQYPMSCEHNEEFQRWTSTHMVSL